ncbi:MAG: hypothetical protein BGO77_07920 [Caedibacter sp. 37-49]|nr:MAG: hypothetical protein BGO77_07920 [Caedibacter sp. 37-49]
MSTFLVNAFAASSLFSFAAGPLGAMIIWRRLAFFGDTLSHGALLGMSLSLAFNFHPIMGIFFISVILAIFLGYSSNSPALASETRLAILSPGLLSLGMICFSLFKRVRFNLEGYLFGDILAVNIQDLVSLLLGEIVVLSFLIKQWKALINICISEDLAMVEGYNVARVRIMFLFILALFIALTVKIMGVLLMTALLILPAVLARNFSKTPERMALLAIGVGIIITIIGLCISNSYDISAAPAIVTTGVTLIILLEVLKCFRKAI